MCHTTGKYTKKFMVRSLVGSIAALWRYPVKSMLGEELTVAEVTERGLYGDRAYALLDTQTGRIASAKNPKKWAKLLDYQATLPTTSTVGESVPPVKVIFPDGQSITSARSDVHDILSTALARDVQLLSTVPTAASLEQYWPPVEGTPQQEAITQLFMPPGTFFDSCSIHAMTTATLARLQELYPEGQFEFSRFRPNLVIAPTTTEIDFVEDDWVGGVLSIGETVKLRIDTACPRCVVTTLAQSGLPNDLNILRTTAQHNNIIAGIRASVIQPGTIGRDDQIWLEKVI